MEMLAALQIQGAARARGRSKVERAALTLQAAARQTAARQQVWRLRHAEVERGSMVAGRNSVVAGSL